MSLKWDTVSGLTTSTTNVRGPGTGAGSAVVATASTQYARKMSLQPSATYLIGCAYFITQFPADWTLCTFWETTSQAQVCVRLGATGTITVYRGNEATSIGTLSAAMPNLNQWYVIECKLITDPSVGQVLIKINGSQVLTITGANTQGGATTSVNGVGIGSPFPSAGSFSSLYIDDFYALNDAGPYNNDFIGTMRVGTLLPSAPGSASDFTPIGSSPNYTCVDDAPVHDADTTYVSGLFVNNTDTYDFPSLIVGASNVAGVQINLVARKDDVQPRTIMPVQRNLLTKPAARATAALVATANARPRGSYQGAVTGIAFLVATASMGNQDTGGPGMSVSPGTGIADVVLGATVGMAPVSPANTATANIGSSAGMAARWLISPITASASLTAISGLNPITPPYAGTATAALVATTAINAVLSDGSGLSSSDLTQAYTDVRSIYDTSLLTGNPWTVPEVNTSEFGVRITT